MQEVYEALVLGTRDYVRKNGFTDVLIGLSGGIDSSLVAAIAVDALGADRVVGVLMPSRFSSDGSVTDADALAANLGIRTITVPIEAAHGAFLDLLEPTFAGTEPGLAEENLQARIRGTILMTMSNKFGALVLTTGNKSEMATGYSTLYGDMAGGFSVIKDVPKMLVYALCRDRNERAMRPLIPDTVLEKAPSAELRPDQKDSDSLPEYEELDPIIEGYVEDDLSIAELEDGRVRLGDGAQGRPVGRPQRVQASPGAPGRARLAQGVRQGSSPSHHQSLARLGDPNLEPEMKRSRARRAGRRSGIDQLSKRFAAEAALVGAALLYGVTFPLVHDALDDITPFAYLLGRFGIATLILLPVALPALRTRGPDRRMLVRAGLTAGVILFGGYATQTVGLQYTSPSTSAFITGLVRRDHPGDRVDDQPPVAAASVIAGIVMATVGLYLLTGADVHLGRGEVLTLACAVLFAFHIVYIGAYAQPPPPVAVHRVADRRGGPALGRAGRRAGRRIAQRPRGVRGGVHRDRVLGDRVAVATVGATTHPARRAPR